MKILRRLRNSRRQDQVLEGKPFAGDQLNCRGDSATLTRAPFVEVSRSVDRRIAEAAVPELALVAVKGQIISKFLVGVAELALAIVYTAETMASRRSRS